MIGRHFNRSPRSINNQNGQQNGLGLGVSFELEATMETALYLRLESVLEGVNDLLEDAARLLSVGEDRQRPIHVG